MALLMSMWIAKICMPRLAHFLLYNSHAWLKTRSDGANVAVIPRSYGQQPSDKGYDIHFSCTHKTGISNIFVWGLHSFYKGWTSYAMWLFRDMLHSTKSSFS